MRILLSTISFCSLFVSIELPGAQSLLFTNSTYRVGMGPYSVAAADINGDGRLDLITANVGDNTLTILTNDGNGGFVSNATLNVGSSLDSVIAVDINGCGKLDLICANIVTNTYTMTLTILTNNGSGVFGSNSTLNVGKWSESAVVAADVNGDGRPDLIAGLTVLTNNGNGGFVSNATLNISPLPTCIVTADINGDGKVDLIIGTDAGVTVLTNDGSGGFESEWSFGVGGSVSVGLLNIAAADFNADGKPDLMASIYDHGYIDCLLLTNDGSGGFAFASEWNRVNYGALIVAADANGDGKADLICDYGNYGDELIVLTNSGSGVFGTNTILNVGSPAQSILAADLNGDGRMDFVTAHCSIFTDNEYVYYTNTITVSTQIAALPTLAIASIAPNAVLISWSWTTNFVLQTNADLSTTNWGIPGYTVSTNGQTESVIINPLPSENLFFRLMSR